MRYPCWVVAILLIIAIEKCVAQDSAKSYLNSVEASFRLEHYPNGFERTYLYVQYGRKIGPVDVFGKVLRYTVGKEVSYLFESEAYIKSGKAGYWYFDAAYSASDFLPNYRLRGERFQNWRRFEYSAGVGVVKPHQFKVIPLFTGTFGYYFSDYFIYARPTFSHVDDGFAKSLFIQARRYFSKTDFIAVGALRGADTGTSRSVNAIANTFGLDTYLFRLNAQIKKGKYKLGAGIDYGGIFIPGREVYMTFTGVDLIINREF